MADLTREQLNDARSRWLNGEDPSTEDMASILAMARECLDLREGVTGCKACDRRDKLDDEHRAELLSMIGDEKLAKDNSSWRRVLDALQVRVDDLLDWREQLATELDGERTRLTAAESAALAGAKALAEEVERRRSAEALIDRLEHGATWLEDKAALKAHRSRWPEST